MTAFDVQIEAPRLEVSKGDPIEGHLPAIEIPRDRDRSRNQFVALEIITGPTGNFPVWSEREIESRVENRPSNTGSARTRDTVRKIETK